MKQTQHQAILWVLENGARITALDALDLCGTMKLSSRVGELKKKGYNIRDEYIRVESGKHVKIYWMEA